MAWWRIAPKSGHSFNICDFVLRQLCEHSSTKGRPLELDIYERSDGGDDPAYVTFKPLTLHVDKKVWEDANLGKGYARYIVAHEIGHIVLHDEFAAAFSDEEAAQLKYLQDEESGEWQANVFAGYFLVPDHVALKFKDIEVIAGLCVVDDDVADKRLREAMAVKITLNPFYEGEICASCGNFTLLRKGIYLSCDTCGTIAGS